MRFSHFLISVFPSLGLEAEINVCRYKLNDVAALIMYGVNNNEVGTSLEKNTNPIHLNHLRFMF